MMMMAMRRTMTATALFQIRSSGEVEFIKGNLDGWNKTLMMVVDGLTCFVLLLLFFVCGNML